MKNPFKEILHHEEVPKVLREKVLNDVGKIKLSIDIADLFVVKYPNTISDLLNGGKLRNKKPNKSSEKDNTDSKLNN